MIPGTKIDWTKITRKAQDTSNEVYHKYGKDYRIDDYVNEYAEGTRASEIVKKAEGLDRLPRINEDLKETGICIDMNEDIFTLNRKIKLGNIAKRNLDKIAAQQKEIEEMAAKDSVKEGE